MSEVRELLEKAIEITETMSSGEDDPIEICCNTEALKGILPQALALLKPEPTNDESQLPCPTHGYAWCTCGNVGQFPLQQPEPTGEVAVCNICIKPFDNPEFGGLVACQCCVNLGKAALESQPTGEVAELEKKHQQEIFNLNDKCVAMRKQLQAQLTAAKEMHGNAKEAIAKLQETISNYEGEAISQTLAIAGAGKKITKLQAEIEGLRGAFGLARSMVLSGEKMSPQAEEVFDQALKGGE